MQREAMIALGLGALVLFLVAFFILALNRARKRRFSEVDEAPPVTQAPDDGPASATARTRPELDAHDQDSAPQASSLDDPNTSDRAIASGLRKTRESFHGKFNALLGTRSKLDASVLEELEDVLLSADVGVGLTTDFVDELRDELGRGELTSADDIRASLRQKMMAVVAADDGGENDPLSPGSRRPRVILFVGVNGVGKTTTIGKLAAKLTERGHSVVLAAGDTFRAAAAEQLEIWAERSGSRLIRGSEGTDPASVIFNAVTHAVDTDADYVLADTAGRLHTKTELMDEIKKVKRAASKARDSAPDETWLVVDATTGQNGLQQATEFHQALELSGMVLTKLDGTAKGGVVVAISSALGIPIRFVGVGERVQDLCAFRPKQFIDALFDTA